MDTHCIGGLKLIPMPTMRSKLHSQSIDRERSYCFLDGSIAAQSQAGEQGCLCEVLEAVIQAQNTLRAPIVHHTSPMVD